MVCPPTLHQPSPSGEDKTGASASESENKGEGEGGKVGVMLCSYYNFTLICSHTSKGPNKTIYS